MIDQLWQLGSYTSEDGWFVDGRISASQCLCVPERTANSILCEIRCESLVVADTSPVETRGLQLMIQGRGIGVWVHEREVEASLTAWRGRLRNSLPFRENKNKNKIEILSGHR